MIKFKCDRCERIYDYANSHDSTLNAYVVECQFRKMEVSCVITIKKDLCENCKRHLDRFFEGDAAYSPVVTDPILLPKRNITGSVGNCKKEEATDPLGFDDTWIRIFDP